MSKLEIAVDYLVTAGTKSAAGETTMDGDTMDHFALAHFRRARNLERLSRVFKLISRRPDRALSFHESKSRIKVAGESYIGVKAVSVRLIVGSEGRSGDFDGAFLPKRNHIQQRWVNIYRANQRGIGLPPVVLYEIAGVYFVRDGNHRVSVARYQGAETIDAEIVSLRPDVAS